MARRPLPKAPGNSETRLRGGEGRALLPALVLAAFGARLAVVMQLHDHPLLQPGGGLDADYYAGLGARIAAGDVWLRGLGPEPFVVAPLYAYFLGLVFALAGGSLLAARVVQAVLGGVAVLLTYRTALRWGGPVAAGAGAALLATTGFVAFSEALISQSALDPVLTALALWAWGEALGRDRPRPYAWAGTAFGLLALNRPNALAVALALALLVGLARRDRAGLLRAAALAGGLALAVSPALLRNLAVSGQAVAISAHGGLNFYIGNHAAADGRYRSVPGVRPNIAGQAGDARRVASAGAGRELSATQASGWFYAQAFEWLRAHPGEALALQLRKLGYLLHGADLALNHSYDYYARDERTLLGALFVGPWLLVPAGLLGLAMRSAARPRQAFALWAAFVPLTALTIAAFFVTSRYRLPLLVPLAIGTGLLAEWGLAAWRGGRRTALAVAGLALVVLTVAANRPLGVDTGRDAERATMLEALIDAGRVDEARTRLAAWEAEARDPARLLLRSGRALGARGDYSGAAELLGRAAERAPGSAEVRLALGVARLRAGDAARAVPLLRGAFEAGEQPAVSGFELARAQASAGDAAGARGTLAALGRLPDLDEAGLRELGALALEVGDAEGAAGFYQRLTVLAPADVDALQKLGVAQGLAGRSRDAVETLRRALALAPDRAELHLNLAVALTGAGRVAEARAAVGRALELRPDYPQARGLLEALDQDPTGRRPPALGEKPRRP